MEKSARVNYIEKTVAMSARAGNSLAGNTNLYAEVLPYRVQCLGVLNANAVKIFMS